MNLKKKFPIWVGVLTLTCTVGGRAWAFMGECSFALDTDTLSQLSTKHVSNGEEGVFHQSFTVELGEATLRPGDTVLAHGARHTSCWRSTSGCCSHSSSSSIAITSAASRTAYPAIASKSLEGRGACSTLDFPLMPRQVFFQL